MIIGSREFKNRTYIMGILNVTPDSFSDGGRFNRVENALKHAEEMIQDGADIIDIGGESTRPGCIPVSDDEEMERIIPVIEKIKAEFDIPVSVDTYKSTVAIEAIKSGADMLNDIWGFKHDREMADAAAKYDLACCLTHNRKNTVYSDLIEDVLSDLRESIDIAVSAGVEKDKIIIDPGIGFAKSYEQNLEITRKINMLHTLGFPLLYAASRKSMIGNALGLPVGERLEGTIATTVYAVLKGCLFVRVHDVKENRRAVLMTEKIIGRC